MLRENAQQSKWVETGIKVCDRNVTNWLKEMRFTKRKAKQKTLLKKKTG